MELKQQIVQVSGEYADCRELAESLKEYGLVIVKDVRASEKDNDTFIDMMETYFEQTDFKRDARPNIGYQVGVTPPNTERPKNYCSKKHSSIKNTPLTICPPELDHKCRFFWRMGPRPLKTEFEELNAMPVIPNGFPQWKTTMDTWGNKLLQTLEDVVEMLAIGLDLRKDTFSNLMQNGPHLLAPTGSDFYNHGQLNTVLAGYHYDLNLLTIHGKSRFPGLYVWLRNGEKKLVKVPKGCLLIQAGKQLEYLTGGHILAGFHEVVVNEDTLRTIEERKHQKKSLWRVSSTLFAHTASDNTLQPLPPFVNEQSVLKYPKILAGDQVRKELQDIDLLAK